VENEVIVVSQHWPWIPVLPLLFLLSKNYLWSQFPWLSTKQLADVTASVVAWILVYSEECTFSILLAAPHFIPKLEYHKLSIAHGCRRAVLYWNSFSWITELLDLSTVRYSKKTHTGPVFVLRCKEEGHLFCWAP
jgi:hypothetical protein